MVERGTTTELISRAKGLTRSKASQKVGRDILVGEKL